MKLKVGGIYSYLWKMGHGFVLSQNIHNSIPNVDNRIQMDSHPTLSRSKVPCLLKIIGYKLWSVKSYQLCQKQRRNNVHPQKQQKGQYLSRSHITLHTKDNWRRYFTGIKKQGSDNTRWSKTKMKNKIFIPSSFHPI